MGSAFLWLLGYNARAGSAGVGSAVFYAQIRHTLHWYDVARRLHEMGSEHVHGSSTAREAPQTAPDGSSGLRGQRGGDAQDTIIALTTVPDMLLAKRIAHILVEEALAACVNLSAPGLSMYMWQGTLEGAEELTLTIKTTVARLPELYARLCGLHPYDVPEFLVLSVQAGSVAYLDWVAAQTVLRAD